MLTTQELGLDATFYPGWSSIAGVVAAIFGVFIAPLVDAVGAKRALFWGLAVKAAIIAGAGMLHAHWADQTVLVTVIFMVGLSGQLLTIASIALFMNLCSPKIAATQFAVYMALSNLALSTGSGLLGPLDAMFEFYELFLLVAAIDLVMLALIPLFNLERHRNRADEVLRGSAPPDTAG